MTDAARTPLPSRAERDGSGVRPGRVGGGRSLRRVLLRFVLLRLAGMLAVLLVLSLLVFALMHLAPGDLVKTLLGNRQASPDAVAALRARYRLGAPFPVYGAGSGFGSMLWHLVLPAVSLAIGLGAILLKLTRTAMLTELTGDYVTALRARGIGERRVTRVALRNAAIPIVTAASLVLTFLVGGTLLAETIFALPGLGKLLQDSVLFKDIPVVQAVTLLVAALIAVIALLADLSYYLLDARMRHREAAA